jgi:hypothetical protein
MAVQLVTPDDGAVDSGIDDLTITGINIPYSDIVNSVNGGWIYLLNKMRVVASSKPQLVQGIIYSRKDSNGNFTSKEYRAEISPAQKQPVSIVDVDMVFDGKSILQINVLAGQSLNLYFGGKVYKIADYLKVGGNLDMLKKMEGTEL